MRTICAEQLDSTIGALCPDIWSNIQLASEVEPTEEKLWEELVCCILSSQVKFELSHAVTQTLKSKGLLGIGPTDYFYENRLRDFLRAPVLVEGRSIKYRFPNSKANQITTARENIYGSGGSLQDLLDEYSDPLELRNVLVKSVPGLGMKQASMYLRNVSNTYELAVIDSHVLNYMNVMDLVEEIPSTMSKSQYLNNESLLTKYATKFSYPVGCVDYAIWIVMRVARKGGYL